MQEIIDEIKSDLSESRWLSALSLALSLPDICGKVLFPDLENKSRERYVRWYDENLGKYLDPAGIKGSSEYDANEKNPYLDGNLLYLLRCSIFHSGDYTLHKESFTGTTAGKKVAERNKVSSFYLYVNKDNMNPDSVRILGFSAYDEQLGGRLAVEVIGLCQDLCKMAWLDYCENKDMFDRIMTCTHIDEMSDAIRKM